MIDDPNIVRERLNALLGGHQSDAETIKLLTELIGAGGGVTLELDDGRWKLIRRDGRFVIKKDEPRARLSSIPPRPQRPR